MPAVFTFDGDDHLADARKQQLLLKQLQELGVQSLWNKHRRSGERALLVREYQLLRAEIAWRAIRPFHERASAEWGKADQALRAAGLTWPSDPADNHEFFNYLDAVSEPGRRLQWAAGHPKNGHESDPREPQVAFRRSQFTRSRGRAIIKGDATPRGLRAFISTAQQRFMPEMRSLTYGAISLAITKRRDAVADAYMSKHPSADKAVVRARFRRGVKAEASLLAADFIKAFYPTFGRTTNADNVRMTTHTEK